MVVQRCGKGESLILHGLCYRRWRKLLREKSGMGRACGEHRILQNLLQEEAVVERA